MLPVLIFLRDVSVAGAGGCRGCCRFIRGVEDRQTRRSKPNNLALIGQYPILRWVLPAPPTDPKVFP